MDCTNINNALKPFGMPDIEKDFCVSCRIRNAKNGKKTCGNQECINKFVNSLVKADYER